MPSPVLMTASDISLIRGGRLLFSSLSFSLSAGQAIHLVGANGSGKTSLLQIMVGLLLPTRGRIEVLGENPQCLSAQGRADMQYLGHRSAVKDELTVAENIRLNARIFDGIAVSEQVLDEVLYALELQRFRHRLTRYLSAGQKRRVMLARLWLSCQHDRCDKKIWLLDEPFAALDASSCEALTKHIDIFLTLGGGVVLSSHQPLQLQNALTAIALATYQ